MKPLSSKEEAYHLEVMKTGDAQASTTSRELLILHNLRLVAHMVKKYQNVDEDVEELISIGTIGLIKAINTYDSKKGSRLATYAARCIDNELLMMLRARRKITREVSLYDIIGTDREGNEISLIDIIESGQTDIPEQLDLEEQKNRLANLFAGVLSKREKEVLIYRYGLAGNDEFTQQEIGEMLGISRSYVSRIEKKALEKIRVRFEG